MSEIVLYIDDKQEFPDNVDGLLEQTGYQLVHTADPEEALRLVREEEPALVLIEVLLPDCDAFDLMEQMGCSNAESSLPVVIVTRGERTSELYGRAVEMGAKDFLCKPIVRAQILEAVLEYANSEDPKTDNEAEPKSDPRDFEGDLSDQPLPKLVEEPRWYNALTTNCTTTIRQHTRHVAANRPFNWKILVNGYINELGYDRGTIDNSLPFEELKRRSEITTKAQSAGNALDFSRQIRVDTFPGRKGFRSNRRILGSERDEANRQVEFDSAFVV